MTVTYTWKIEQLDVAPAVGGLNEVVSRIHWRLLASDGANGADCYGDQILPPPDPSDFSPYTSLTEEAVIACLESRIDASASADEGRLTVAQLRQDLAGILAVKAAPHAEPLPLPWE